MISLYQKLEETKKFIQSKVKVVPQIGIILGTGLGSLVEGIKNKQEIPYEEIPNFPKATAVGHNGNLVFGELAGKAVLAMEGRFHFYEGHPLEEVTYPVRVAKALGAQALIVSNASGGMNPLFKAGDLMVITDHINFMGVNPLIGANDERLGPRFPDMCETYDSELIELAEAIGIEEKIPLRKGVYVAVTGPNLETKAEYRFLRMIGADAVGMSTVPEVIVAVHAGLKVFGISCITDSCLPDALKPVNIDEIIDTAQKAEPKLTRVVERLVGRI